MDSPADPAAKNRDWNLFVRWCAATGRELAADRSALEQHLGAFFFSVPAQGSTRRRRAAVVRHRLLGDAVVHEAVPAARGFDDVALLIAAQPPTVRGVRDRALVAVLGAGVSRRRAATLAVGDVGRASSWTIAGRALPFAERADECSRCATAGWCSVLEHLAVGNRVSARSTASSCVADWRRNVHTCLPGLDYRGVAPALFPALDRHGWAGREGLSRRSVYRILKALPSEAVVAPQHHPGSRTDERPVDAAELFSDLAKAEAAVDDLDARAERLLADLQAIADVIDASWSGARSAAGG